MHRRLMVLLRSFSAEQIMRLHQFVQSPFFNENSTLVKLWLFYKRFLPDLVHADFSAARAFAQLFPTESYDKQKINKYNSLLYQLVLTFIAHDHLRNDPHSQMLSRLTYFDEAELDNHFQKNMRQAQQQLDAGPLRNAAHYAKKLQLARAQYVYQSRRDERDGDIGLQDLNSALDTDFMIQKLEQLCLMVARQRAVQVHYRMTWLAEVEAYRQSHASDQNPAIQMNHRMLQLHTTPAERTHYELAKQDLVRYASCFTAAEQREFYATLENAAKHCFAPDKYPKALFDLYQQQIQSGLWQELEGMPHSLFRNVAGVAIHLKKFDWAEGFIASYATWIVPQSFREDLRALTEAEWHFYQDRPRQALVALQAAHPDDVYYKLAGKSLLVRIYFRLHEGEALENALNTFTKFVYDQQKRIAAAKVASFRTYINYLRRLYKILCTDATTYDEFTSGQVISARSVQQKLRRLRKRIQSEPFFNGRQWLLGEIEKYV